VNAVRGSQSGQPATHHDHAVRCRRVGDSLRQGDRSCFVRTPDEITPACSCHATAVALEREDSVYLQSAANFRRNRHGADEFPSDSAK
jgi:hypothetical protein